MPAPDSLASKPSPPTCDAELPFTLAELCAVACAEAWRDNGELLASPVGLIPSLGARLARATFAPDLLLTDGEARLVRGVWPLGEAPPEQATEGWLPYRAIFDLVWSGQRHVMMGASQIDAFGNQNIACIGTWARPKAQLIGVRGAPGNTIHHLTSYWIPNHSRRTFVEKVDMVSGVGNDRARALGRSGRFHQLPRVVSNLGVFDFEPAQGRMRLRSLHPGIGLEQVRDQTGFELLVSDALCLTRAPTPEELHLIRNILDPKNFRLQEVAA